MNTLTDQLAAAQSNLDNNLEHHKNAFTFAEGARIRLAALKREVNFSAQYSCGLHPFNFGVASGHARMVAQAPEMAELATLEGMLRAIEADEAYQEAVKIIAPMIEERDRLAAAVAKEEEAHSARIDALAQAERDATATALKKAENDPAVLKARAELAKFTSPADEPITLVRGRQKLATDQPELVV